MEPDPLKNLFRSLPELEPDSGFADRVMEQIRSRPRAHAAWFWEPALALGAVLTAALLATLLSTRVLAPKQAAQNPSPLSRWAEAKNKFMLVPTSLPLEKNT